MWFIEALGGGIGCGAMIYVICKVVEFFADREIVVYSNNGKRQ